MKECSDIHFNERAMREQPSIEMDPKHIKSTKTKGPAREEPDKANRSFRSKREK